MHGRLKCRQGLHGRGALSCFPSREWACHGGGNEQVCNCLQIVIDGQVGVPVQLNEKVTVRKDSSSRSEVLQWKSVNPSVFFRY